MHADSENNTVVLAIEYEKTNLSKIFSQKNQLHDTKFPYTQEELKQHIVSIVKITNAEANRSYLNACSLKALIQWYSHILTAIVPQTGGMISDASNGSDSQVNYHLLTKGIPKKIREITANIISTENNMLSCVDEMSSKFLYIISEPGALNDDEKPARAQKITDWHAEITRQCSLAVDCIDSIHEEEKEEKAMAEEAARQAAESEEEAEPEEKEAEESAPPKPHSSTNPWPTTISIAILFGGAASYLTLDQWAAVSHLFANLTTPTLKACATVGWVIGCVLIGALLGYLFHRAMPESKAPNHS